MNQWDREHRRNYLPRPLWSRTDPHVSNPFTAPPSFPYPPPGFQNKEATSGLPYGKRHSCLSNAEARRNEYSEAQWSLHRALRTQAPSAPLSTFGTEEIQGRSLEERASVAAILRRAMTSARTKPFERRASTGTWAEPVDPDGSDTRQALRGGFELSEGGGRRRGPGCRGPRTSTSLPAPHLPPLLHTLPRARWR